MIHDLHGQRVRWLKRLTASPGRPPAPGQSTTPAPMGASWKVWLPPWLVALAMLAYTGYFGATALARHAAFITHAQDLGYFDQTIWGTARGRPLWFTVYDLNLTVPEGRSFLAYHVEPLLILLAPLYWLWDDVRALLLVQPVILALAAVPAYRLGKLRLGSAWGGLAIALLLLLNPTIQAAPINDFHTLAFAPLLLLLALLALLQRQWLRLAGWCGLAILIKEQVSLMIALIGLVVLLDGLRHGWPGKRRQAIVGLSLALGGALWFLLSVAVVIPFFVGHQATESPFVARYGRYGASLLGIIQTLLTRPDIVWRVTPKEEVLLYWLNLLLGGGLVSLVSPLVLLAAPELAINSLSSFGAQRASATHYSLSIVAFIIAGAADGAGRLASWLSHLPRHRIIDRLGRRPIDGPGRSPVQEPSRPAGAAGAAVAGILAMALIIAGLNAIDHGFLPGMRKYRQYLPAARHAEASTLIASIPAADPVTVQENLLPHLTHRFYVYPFAYGFTPPRIGGDPPPEWVLMDVTAAVDRVDGRSLEREVYAETGYGVMAATNGYLLLRRGLADKRLPDDFFRFARAEAAEIGQPARLTSADRRLTHLGTTVTWVPDPWSHRDHRATITSYWRAEQPLERDLRFEIAGVDEPTRPALSRSPTTVWWPSSRWPTGTIIRIVHGTLTIASPRTLLLTAGQPDGEWPVIQTRLVLTPPPAPGLAGMLDDLQAWFERGPLLRRAAQTDDRSPTPSRYPPTHASRRYGGQLD